MSGTWGLSKLHSLSDPDRAAPKRNKHTLLPGQTPNSTCFTSSKSALLQPSIPFSANTNCSEAHQKHQTHSSSSPTPVSRPAVPPRISHPGLGSHLLGWTTACFLHSLPSAATVCLVNPQVRAHSALHGCITQQSLRPDWRFSPTLSFLHGPCPTGLDGPVIQDIAVTPLGLGCFLCQKHCS